jgi:RHS repeat-associated protein
MVSGRNGMGLLPSTERDRATNLASSSTNGRGNLTSYTYDAKGNVTSITDVITGQGLGGSGNGSFIQTEQFSNTASRSAIAMGDLNGDGTLDVVAISSLNTAAIFLGNGDGSVNGSTIINGGTRDLFVGNEPQALALQDLNGDGKLDLIIANGSSNEVSVLFQSSGASPNTGTVNFQPRLTLSTGSSSTPTALAMGDVNGDGIVDIVATKENDNTVAVLLNNGDGSFQSAVTYAVGAKPVAVVLGLFDSDTHLDLLTANETGQSLTLLKGSSTGSFSPLSTYALGAEATRGLAIADLNGDNQLDVVVGTKLTGSTPAQVKVLHGNGAGGFTEVASSNQLVDSIAIGDLDQDNDLDLLLGMGYLSEPATPGGTPVGLKALMQGGNGSFSPVIDSPVGHAGQQAVLGDLDGDGDLDAATAARVTGRNTAGVFIGLSAQLGVANPRRYTYDSIFNQVTSETDELGRQTLYDIDPLTGNQRSVTRVVGAIGGSDDLVTQYTYTPDGRIATMVDPLGRITEYDYSTAPITQAGETLLNPTGQLRRLTVAKGTPEEASQWFGYDVAGNQTVMIDENNRVTRYQYDLATNRLLKTISADPDGTGPQTASVTTYTYDAMGNQTKVIDANGNVTESQYDSMGRLVKTISADPDGILGPQTSSTTTYRYDENGNQVAMVDALGRETLSVYDARNRLVETIQADGSRQTMGYDADNNPNQETDGNGNLSSRKTYDARGRLIRERDAQGKETTYQYDVANQLVETKDAQGKVTQYKYDELGRRIQLIEKGSGSDQITRTEYDKAGNVTAEIDALNNRTEYRYDNRDRRTVVVDADNTDLPLVQQKATTTVYDNVGNVLSITDPVGNTTSYIYDGLNRLTTETNSLGKTRSFTYDANGNQTSVTDRNGRTRSFTYDALNRQTEENWLASNGSVIRSTQSFYDPLNQLVGLTDPSSSYSYSYDLNGRLKTVSNFGTPGVPTVLFTYGYDNTGNVTSVTEAINGVTSSTTAYTYDSLNRVGQIVQTGTAVQAKRVDFSYNSIGQVSSMKRYSNAAGTQVVAETIHTYDPFNRLVGINHQRANGSSINNYTFGYDAADRITAITDIDGTTTYSYDRSNELTGADRPGTSGDEAYIYDANGNRTNAGYQTGSNNRLQTDGIYTYTYDDEGNLKTRTTIATNAVREYTWDYRNRLTSVVDRTGSNTTRQSTYTYDVTNQRIAKTVDLDGAGTAPATTTRFVYDRNNVALEFTGTATVPSTRYFHGTDVDQVLAQESSNTTTWLLSDQVGTTRDLVNNSGTLLNHFTYDSFGNQTGSTPNATVDTRYKFTGRELDAETGDYFYRARYYDPETARFLSEDPIGFGSEDANLYRYVSNSPLDTVDPYGDRGTPRIFPVTTPRTPGSGARPPTRLPSPNSAPTASPVAPQAPYSNPLTRQDVPPPVSDMQLLQQVSKTLGLPKPPNPNQCDPDRPPCESFRQGGAYGSVRRANRNPGAEVHHMPSWSATEASGLRLGLDEKNYRKAPAICMLAVHHHQTASYGSSASSSAYRRNQARFMSNLLYDLAQNMDVVDVKTKFGTRYDYGIIQMRNYTSQLKNQQPNLFRR